MVYLAWFILGFTLLQLMVALANLVFRQAAGKGVASDLVSVLIPARNEEKNIGTLLAALKRQDYRNIEILVYDDQSADGTADLVKRAALDDPRIKYLPPVGLPEGWLGKNHACHVLSQKADGAFFLFMDADVSISGNIIGESLVTVKENHLGLLTFFPVQVMKTFSERITVPNMNYILLSLLPLVLVERTRKPSLAAANGQFMFFNAAIYRKYKPHEKLRKYHVEDIRSARYLKENGVKVSCRAAGMNLSCRMYTGFKDAVDGFSRSIISFFGNSFLLAILFWLFTTFGMIMVYASLSLVWFLVYIAAIVLTRVFISITSRQPAVMNLLLAIPQQVTMGMFIYRALMNRLKKHLIWKDRKIAWSS